MRRAGFAACLARMWRCKKTWGDVWASGQAMRSRGARTILERLSSIEAGQWQFGKTKLFVRSPESVFHVEELNERKDFDEICKMIQRAWRACGACGRRPRLPSSSTETRSRRRDSMDRRWVGDQINYEDKFDLQDVMEPYKEEVVVYADEALLLSKKGKVVKRFILVSGHAFYLVQRNAKKGVVSWQAMRDLAVSTVQDGYLVMDVGNEHSAAIERGRKTELIIAAVRELRCFIMQHGMDILMLWSILLRREVLM